LPGSPAIDKGNNFTPYATDQRVQPRVRGAAPDIGAVGSGCSGFTVTATADSGPGSLRQAIPARNTATTR